MASEKKDEWEEVAKIYGKVASNTTSIPTVAFLEKANKISPFSSATAILDNGCGPGPVTSALLAKYSDEIPDTTKLYAADFSPAMIQAMQKLKDGKSAAGENHWSRITTSTQDAQVLDGFDDASLSHVLAGMMYMLVPDPQKALKVTHRVLKQDGIIAFSSWKDSEWMEIMEIPQTYTSDEKLKMSLPQAYRSPEGIESELKQAGFKDVEAEYVQTHMEFDNHENMAKFFGQAPHVAAVLRGLSTEDRAEAEQKMLEMLKSRHPKAPGRLEGTAVIAVARK